MKYPFLISFISISLGIITSHILALNFPVLIFLLLLIILSIFSKKELSLILLVMSCFLFGYFITEKPVKDVKSMKNLSLQCKVINIPSVYKKFLKFDCKVEKSNYKELLDKNLKVFLYSKNSTKLPIFLHTNLNLNGNLKVKDNSLNFYVKNFQVNNKNNPFISIFNLKNCLKENFKDKTTDKILYSLGEAVIFGDRYNIDEETKKIFKNSGLIHLLAISGLHVGILISILLILFYPLKREIKYLLTIFIITLFPIFTGLKIPVVRASLMGILFLLSKIKNFKINSLNILFFVGTAVLIFNPKALFSPSFQLSFIAVLGILLFVEKHKLKVNNFYQYLIIGIVISIVATLFTTPVLIYHFGKFSPVSIIGTPIALIPMYPYISLAVLNILTGFQIDILVNVMNKFGQIFIGITSFFADLDLYFIGFKPDLFFTTLILVIFLIIFISNLKAYVKILISVPILLIFLFFSKTDNLIALSKENVKNYEILEDKRYILLKLTNECYLYMKRKYSFIKTVLNKEGCEKVYLVIKRKKRYKFNADKYIPLNSEFKGVKFFQNGRDIVIKIGDEIVYPKK
ncbi:MAG: hypothetical protein DSY66_04095 [Persephonella sp.]|nr:MAG: hypothetical protein DSY66_04095 [Persephonella sp.]